MKKPGTLFRIRSKLWALPFNIFNRVTWYGLCIIKAASQVTPCLRHHKLISAYTAYWFEGLSTWTQWQVALPTATTVPCSRCQINFITTSPQNESCSSNRCSSHSLIPITNKLHIQYEAIIWTSTNYHRHICVKNQQMHPLFIQFHPTCFGITLPSSGSVPSAFWKMINWGVADWILWMGVLCLVTWCARTTSLDNSTLLDPTYTSNFYLPQITHT
jgi:hypothetical protein